jgi:uncharacterized protein
MRMNTPLREDIKEHSMKTAQLGALLAVSAVSLVSIGRAYGQRPEGGPVAKPPSITVLGTGESQSRPDVANVSVGVVSDGKNAQEASSINANQTEQVVSALRKAGIADKDIQTSGYSVQPVYKQGNPAEGIQGYQVSNNVRATVRKLDSIGKVIDAAIKAGANNVHGVGFGLEKREAAEDGALKEAVENARRKADVIARAAGLRITGVREISSAPQEPRPMMMMEASFSRAASATPISPGELTITAQVTVVYDVAPIERRPAGVEGR